jgi:hypothetical protein
MLVKQFTHVDYAVYKCILSTKDTAENKCKQGKVL